jgi:hypothetical protein
MSTLIKIIVLLFCVNLFVYVGMNYQYMITGDTDDKPFKLQGDLIDLLMKFTPAPLNATAGTTVFNESVLGMPPKEAGGLVGTGGGINFLDIPAILWSFFATLFNIVGASILVFFVGGMPSVVGLMIGAPLALIELLCVFAFIRGVGD